MRSLVSVFPLFILAAGGLLSGCSWFSSAPDIPPQQRRIDLRVVAAPRINPGINGQAQPLKLCIVELSREGWSPPGLYQGTLCSGINTGAEVVSVTAYILAPSEERQYFRDVPFEQARWWVIAAEFQDMNNGKGLLMLKSDAGADFNRVIFVDGKALSLNVPIDRKVSKEK